MAKKKVVASAFEIKLKECEIKIYEGVNGRTASTTFENKSYSASAPSDMPKRLQKKFATQKVLNLIRKAYGVEEIE